jgi:hypothetical protein
MRARLIPAVLLAFAISVVPESIAVAAPPQQLGTRPGSIGIRLVAAPGASPNGSLASSYIVDRLAPGTSIVRNVEIDNTTRASVDVSVYSAAASILRGSFSFAPGHNGNDLSRWTSVGHDVLRLAPDTESLDSLRISVPRNASSGERYAVLWAEVSDSPTAAGGVELVNRVGIRMYLSIGPGGAPPSSFSVGALTAKRSTAGEPFVVATVRNTGQSMLDLSGSLRLSNGPGGLGAGPFAATLTSVLAPDVSELVIVPLNTELPRGPWQANLGLTNGLIYRSTEATITFPRNAAAAKEPGETGFPLLILVVFGLLLLLVITALALLASRRSIVRMRPI